MKVFIEHYIQREILRALSRSHGLRFSELKPDGLENNIFMYHLQQLMKQGLVKKDGLAYGLSADGLRYVSQVTRTNLDLLPQPRLFSLLIIMNGEGECVMHQRSAGPYLSRLTFPGGALAFDEQLQDHVARQLQEKVGLKVPLTYRGTGSLRLGQDGQIISHTYAQLFYARINGRPDVQAQDQRFTPKWVSPAKVADYRIMPDIRVILERLTQDDELFFLDVKRTDS